MKGEGRYSSDSESHSPHSSDSGSTCSSSSSSSSSSLSCSSRSSGYKKKRNHKKRDSDNGGSSHKGSKRRSKYTQKSKTDDHHRNVKFKKSSASREDTTKQKTKKCTRRRVAVKSKGESSYSEDEERIYKKKRKEREERKKNKLKKRNKGDIKQQKEVCDLDMLHQNGFDAGKSYEENRAFQALADAKEQQKAIIQHNAEVAKARLASGELQRARNEQMKMQDLYGVVDWRAKKKLRKEKRMLERTVATGKKLARLDERETARMDAFRVAVGLPTAEAQRQAEWRVRATESLAELPQGQRSVTSASRHAKVIGPCLPQS